MLQELDELGETKVARLPIGHLHSVLLPSSELAKSKEVEKVHALPAIAIPKLNEPIREKALEVQPIFQTQPKSPPLRPSHIKLRSLTSRS